MKEAPYMEQRAYWDHVAPTKEFTLPLQSELLAQWVTPDSSILDFGCGYGRTLNQLQQLGYQNLCVNALIRKVNLLCYFDSQVECGE